MTIAEEKAWASALATKYGIREPLAPESPARWAEYVSAQAVVDAWTTTGTRPATTATGS